MLKKTNVKKNHSFLYLTLPSLNSRWYFLRGHFDGSKSIFKIFLNIKLSFLKIHEQVQNTIRNFTHLTPCEQHIETKSVHNICFHFYFHPETMSYYYYISVSLLHSKPRYTRKFLVHFLFLYQFY